MSGTKKMYTEQTCLIVSMSINQVNNDWLTRINVFLSWPKRGLNSVDTWHASAPYVFSAVQG